MQPLLQGILNYLQILELTTFWHRIGIVQTSFCAIVETGVIRFASTLGSHSSINRRPSCETCSSHPTRLEYRRGTVG